MFFKVNVGGYRPKSFAFASGYGRICDLWFLSPAFLERRLAYWDVNPELPGAEIEPNAREWPDFLGNGHSPPMFFVSDRVVDRLRSIEALFGRVTEMPIARVNAKALRAKPSPRYYVIETFVGIEVDAVASGFAVDSSGRAVLDALTSPKPSQYRYRQDSWDGSDLFAAYLPGGYVGPHTQMLCTERIKQLAEDEGWTNVCFEPLALV